MRGLRLFALTSLVMVAFASNSILNRLALKSGSIEPMDFALWRMGSGALVLAVLALALGRGLPLARPMRWAGAAALTLYVVAFSLAYVRLDAGIGALIVFGATHVTMFAGALALGEPVPARRWIGAAMALAGLAWLFWPHEAAVVSLPHALLMAAAALGWGIYSLIGRSAGDPLAATAAGFVLGLPIAAAVALVLPAAGGMAAEWRGIGLAVLSGAVTSGLGYALWYAVLPELGSARAAVAQLSSAPIAALGAVLLLGERITPVLLGAGALVLAGIAVANLQRRR